MFTFAAPVLLLAAAASAQDTQKVYYDWVDDEGRLAGGVVWLTVEPPGKEPAPNAGVWSHRVTGSGANRIDVVFVGDGYTDADLPLYAQHVLDAMADMFSIEPFATYQGYFNVHQIDVVSAERGVDHDPTYPIWRDTALDMGFWCGGMERLLCVDVGKAWSYARGAPDVDQVLAVANSTKYGGAGYPDADLATVSGGNSAAAQVALHEMGHSLGNLADEYDYGGPDTYTGPEPGEPNVSIYDHAQMAARGTKWAAWLGEDDPPFDGLHTTYEGAMYSVHGIYRPTYNSQMRSLGRPFNHPSAESLIIQFYREVDPIDAHTPNDDPLTGREVVFVTPMHPVGHDLTIEWSLDGQVLPGQTAPTLDLCSLLLSEGMHDLAVTVTDPTPMVRDEAARATWLTQTVPWLIVKSGPAADFNGDGRVDSQDFIAFLNAFTAGDPSADFNGDGAIDSQDFVAFLNAFVSGC